MKFWKLERPPSRGDYNNLFINGWLRHAWSLPGIECDACGETWSATRTLPVALPGRLRTRKQLKQRWPIAAIEHRTLREEVRTALAHARTPIEVLMPGDSFQPGVLSVPSIPEADFLWASLSSVVVSERVKNLLKSADAKGAEYCRVELGKIGNCKPVLPAPLPKSGEPEDLMSEARPVRSTDAVGPYYDLVITAESGRPAGVEVRSTCDRCGREDLDMKNRQFKMSSGMWNGDDIFFLNTTLYIVVTDPIRLRLEEAGVSNVCFEKI